MTSVRAGSSSGARSANCVPSTFETKWVRRSPASYGASAAVAIAGPRSLPPMPMLTTSVKRSPVAPVRRPAWTARDEGPALRAHRQHLGVQRRERWRQRCAPAGTRSSVCSAGAVARFR